MELSESEKQFKDIKSDPESRFKSIREMARDIQNPQMKKEEIRQYAESIELFADTKWIESMNRALEDVRKGRYTTFEGMMKNIKEKRNTNHNKKGCGKKTWNKEEGTTIRCGLISKGKRYLCKNCRIQDVHEPKGDKNER